MDRSTVNARGAGGSQGYYQYSEHFQGYSRSNYKGSSSSTSSSSMGVANILANARAEAAASLEYPSRPETPSRQSNDGTEAANNFNMIMFHHDNGIDGSSANDSMHAGASSIAGRASSLYQEGKRKHTSSSSSRKRRHKENSGYRSNERSRRNSTRSSASEGSAESSDTFRVYKNAYIGQVEGYSEDSPRKLAAKYKETKRNGPLRNTMCGDSGDEEERDSAAYAQRASDRETEQLAEALKAQTMHKIAQEPSDISFFSDMLNSACKEFSEITEILEKALEEEGGEERICEICQNLFSVIPRFLSATETAHKEQQRLSEDSRALLQAGLDMVVLKRRYAIDVLTEQMFGHSRTVQTYLSAVALSIAGSRSCSVEDGENNEKVSALACKHLFTLSKNEELDNVLRDCNALLAILEQLRNGTVSVVSDDGSYTSKFLFAKCTLTVDSLVYAIGVIKNSSNNADNAHWLVGQGAVEILTRAMAQAIFQSHQVAGESIMLSLYEELNPVVLNADDEQTSLSRKSLNKMILQTCGALRNLCLSKKNLNQFWKSGSVSSLASALTAVPNHSELVLTVCRCLSKLSLHERCRRAFNSSRTSIYILLEILNIHQSEAAIVTRILFVLGNVMTDRNADRQSILSYNSPHDASNGAELVFRALTHYKERFVSPGDDDNAKDNEDVLRKGMRLLANLAIDADMALKFYETGRLSMLQEVLSVASVGENEELVLNTVATLTNVSYNIVENVGDDTEKLSNFASNMGPTVEQTYPLLLLHRHHEALMETVRALANLSRIKELSDRIAESGAMPGLLLLLLHPDDSIALTSCGVLTNIAQHSKGKEVLYDIVVSEQGVLKECGAPGRSDLLQVSIQSPTQALDMVVDLIMSSFQEERYSLCVQSMRLLHNYLASVASESPDSGCGMLDVSQLTEALDVVGRILETARTDMEHCKYINNIDDVASELLRRLRVCVSEGLIADDDDNEVTGEDLPRGGILSRRGTSTSATDLEPLEYSQ
eukprot:gb/GECG01014613.1/.p1 GENE.gb/GECG01014613.1/~~gb/GECG01014613.1/.p1  ORF type:complete len:1003 (+),score=151.26 gb/GECG01014613.1/:1-3009(+)